MDGVYMETLRRINSYAAQTAFDSQLTIKD
jgi:hypothetical protein